MAVVLVNSEFGDKSFVGSEVTVNVTSTGDPADLFSDADGSVPQDNPVTVGPNGRIVFYIDPGTYTLVGDGLTRSLTVDAPVSGGGGGVTIEDVDAAVAAATTDEALPSTLTRDTELSTGLAAKQDASTAATDTELASEASARIAADALKQDASTAATDTELAAEATRAQAAEALLQPAATAATDAELAGHTGASTGAHAASAVSVTTSGLVVVTHTNVQAALADLDTWAAGRPTHTSGLLSALPANGAVPDGSTYLATDQNGGTLYRMVSAAWVVSAAAVNAALGMLAGPVYLSSSFDIKAVANTMTDVTGMSVAVPASSKIVVVRFKCEVTANGGTSTSGTVLSAFIELADSSNVAKAFSSISFTSTGASVVQGRDCVLEFVLEPPVSAATYKVRAQTSAAIPTNWSSMAILPGVGQVSGGKDSLTAIGY